MKPSGQENAFHGLEKQEKRNDDGKTVILRRIRAGGWFLFGLCAIGYYLIAGMTGGFGISVLWVWLVVGLVISCLGIADFIEQTRRNRSVRYVLLGMRCLIYVCAAAFFTVEGLVVSRMDAECPSGVEYLLVPGAMVYGEEPSDVLRHRVESATEYLVENPETIAVLCGGQGEGESISEAECMQRLLLEAGIPPERILLEDRSVNTEENMRYAYAIVNDPDAEIGVVTSNFHVWRTVHLAKKCGWRSVSGMAASCRGILLLHYMAREFLTISVNWLHGNL